MKMAETQQSITCSYAIQTFKQGPANYQSILGTGVTYTDSVFKAGSTAITWPSYPR